MTPSRSINMVDTPTPLSLCRSQSSMYRRIFSTLSYLSLLRLFNHADGQRDVNIHARPPARHAIYGNAPVEKSGAFLHTHDPLMVAASPGWHSCLLIDALAIVRDTDIDMSFIV